MLALFGWQNEDPGIPSLVSCSACFRRLGLWLFRKKPVDQGRDSEEGEASVCRLDLIGEHRDVSPFIPPYFTPFCFILFYFPPKTTWLTPTQQYCPWINAASQGKEAGWRSMLQVLQHAPKGSGTSGAASVYSLASVASQQSVGPTSAERDAEDDSKLKKLRRLKTLYFGKKKKEAKTAADKEKDTV